MKADDGLEIWFLTGSQSMYGDETLAQVARQSKEIAATLDAAAEISVPIVWKPTLTTAPAIRQACLDATASDNCVGVIAWMHTFSPAKMWIGGLDALRKPLLHFHTQANLSLPWSEIDMDFMNLNQAAHGDREFGYIETRMRVRRKTVVGHASDERARQRIGAWARATIGVHAAKNLRLARFGDNMRDVAVTDGDKTDAQIVFGMSVKTYGVTELASAVDAVSEDDVDALVAHYDELYDVAPGLRSGGDRH
jgi:L-arabinose isomerase